MNLFQKYGIKEVADVVFYSVSRIGDEEFYTPVLFLDTLKVSTLEKSAEKVNAKGGKGNKKLITWNFGKEITLNLEDALFSPASMSMIWGGELQSRLSVYTSAIVKLNLANKYGSLHYSTKAYPSPALTDDEWEIVFQAAQIADRISWTETAATHWGTMISNIQGAGVFTSVYGIAQEPQCYVAYYQTIDIDEEERGAKCYFFPEAYGGVHYNYTESSTEGSKIITTNRVNPEDSWNDDKYIYHYAGVVYQVDDEWYLFDPNSSMPGVDEKGAVFRLIKTQETITVPSGPSSGNTRVLNLYKVPRYWAENYNGDSSYIEEDRANLRKTYFYRNGEQEDEKAMRQSIINNIIKMIDNIKKLGYIETQIYDVEVIDRMERCIVTNKNGLSISTSEQKKNLLRYYQNDQTSSYTIYYDAKTMQPLLSLTDDGIIRGWDDGIYDKNFDMKTDTDLFKIKIGTVYYKWTRTVKYKNGDDDGILGRTFVIDADTFPEAYKIVGETYIRDQKTGQDQRYQFIIHRAQVNADTSITLQADGDPTTFSMSVEVLTPPNDIMIELKQFDVDEDQIHGGTKIIPQKSKYTYTPTSIVLKEKVDIDNPEIY